MSPFRTTAARYEGGYAVPILLLIYTAAFTTTVAWYFTSFAWSVGYEWLAFAATGALIGVPIIPNRAVSIDHGTLTVVSWRTVTVGLGRIRMVRVNRLVGGIGNVLVYYLRPNGTSARVRLTMLTRVEEFAAALRANGVADVDNAHS